MSNAAIFRQVLTQGGLPPHVVEAAIANFIWESGGQTDIDTTNQTGDDGNSWGAAQWQGGRRTALLHFAAQRGTNWTDPETQALFVLHELNGPEASAKNALLSATTPEQALSAWTNRYERAGTPHMEGRLGVLRNLGATAYAPTPPNPIGLQPDASGGNLGLPTEPLTTPRQQRLERRADRVFDRGNVDRSGRLRERAGEPRQGLLDRVRQRIKDRDPTRDTRVLDTLIANRDFRRDSRATNSPLRDYITDRRHEAGLQTFRTPTSLRDRPPPLPPPPLPPSVAPGPVTSAPLFTTPSIHASQLAQAGPTGSPTAGYNDGSDYVAPYVPPGPRTPVQPRLQTPLSAQEQYNLLTSPMPNPGPPPSTGTTFVTNPAPVTDPILATSLHLAKHSGGR